MLGKNIIFCHFGTHTKVAFGKN